ELSALGFDVTGDLGDAIAATEPIDAVPGAPAGLESLDLEVAEPKRHATVSFAVPASTSGSLPAVRPRPPPPSRSGAVTSSGFGRQPPPNEPPERPYDEEKMAAVVPDLVAIPAEVLQEANRRRSSGAGSGWGTANLPEEFVAAVFSAAAPATGDDGAPPRHPTATRRTPAWDRTLGPLPPELLEARADRWRAETAAVSTTAESAGGFYIDGKLQPPARPLGWSTWEVEALDAGIAAVGKSFTRVSRDFVPTRSAADCIEAFYLLRHGWVSAATTVRLVCTNGSSNGEGAADPARQIVVSGGGGLRSVRARAYRKQAVAEEAEYARGLVALQRHVAAETRRLRAEAERERAATLVRGAGGMTLRSGTR
ncbi:hypothetical protein HK405_013217, partial [Cladochytrium tenue]